jgi:hypothetical protein
MHLSSGMNPCKSTPCVRTNTLSHAGRAPTALSGKPLWFKEEASHAP